MLCCTEAAAQDGAFWTAAFKKPYVVITQGENLISQLTLPILKHFKDNSYDEGASFVADDVAAARLNYSFTAAFLSLNCTILWLRT